MTTPPIALAPLGFLELSPPELISIAAEAGFGSVAIRACAATPGGVAYPLEPGSAALCEVRARMQDTGTGLIQLEMVSLEKATVPADYEAMLAGGAELGCRRVVASGNDPDLALVADRLDELCEHAARYEMVVDLEFMPFRALMTLSQADALVTRAGADNARIMIDTLHLFRSGGSVELLRGIYPQRLGVVQICDAPRRAPPPDRLADEAREARLVPGEGELPLVEVMRVLPADIVIAAECPIQRQYPDFPPAERAALIYQASRRFLDGLVEAAD